MNKKEYNRRLDKLQSDIGYEFKDRNLLLRALTHSSFTYSMNMSRIECYERLEFFGDSILQLISSEYLFFNEKEEEGEMTQKRSHMVRGQTLAKVSDRLGLPELMRRQEGAKQLENPLPAGVCADLVEALIAAVYIEAGLDETKRMVLRIMKDEIEEAIKVVNPKGMYKSNLQELLQQDGPVSIKYCTIKEEGPPHNKRFWVDVRVNGARYGRGSGKSKKEAEQEAAKQALEKLE